MERWILEIATEAKEFYKRLETFTNSLGTIGNSLNKTVVDYNKSVGSFQGRLLPIARRLEALQVSDSELNVLAEIESNPRLIIDEKLERD